MIYASVHDMLINNGLAISRKRLLRSASIRLHASTEAPENSYTCPLKRQKIPLSPLLIASYAAVSCLWPEGWLRVNRCCIDTLRRYWTSDTLPANMKLLVRRFRIGADGSG